MTIKRVIARLHPVTMTPVVFMVDSKKDSQIDAFIDGQTKRVGIEVYQHSQKLTREDAIKVAKVFAEHENIPVEELLVRDRMPKTNKEPVQHNRRTNDAALTLVKTEEKQTLARAAQELHDSAMKQSDSKSTPDNPEGATVKPQEKTVRTKRAYNKKSEKEISKRSAAALRRYEQEIRQAAAKSPTMQASVQAAAEAPVDNSDKAQEEKLAKALRLAKAMLDAGLI